MFGIFPHIAHLIEARGEGGPREAGLTLAGFALGGLSYTLLVGLMVRFLGQTRMLATGGLVCAGALLAVGLAGNWILDAAALMALGLGFYMLHNTFQTQVTEVAPQARPRRWRCTPARSSAARRSGSRCWASASGPSGSSGRWRPARGSSRSSDSSPRGVSPVGAHRMNRH